MPLLKESSFEPAWWLRNPHFQTLWPALLRQSPRLCRKRECLETPDGDFIELDWQDRGSGPLVILLHGLTGSSNSSYILGMQCALGRWRMSSLALNFRGCSGQPNRTSRCYHSGDTADLDYLYSVLSSRFPKRPMAAIGFSLGGNVLLKWLGECGSDAGLSAAAAISVPMRLDRCADRMDFGLSRMYRNRLLKELREYVEIKRDHLKRIGREGEYAQLAAVGDLSDVRSFWEYDDKVVAPLYGFRDVHDYYGSCSSRPFLSRIQRPTLVVHALDDPFMYPDVIPQAEELSSQVTFELTQGGGHVGFISGNRPGRAEYWLESRIPQFLSRYLFPCQGHIGD